jgi:Holliday junction resolvase RusA-like endonuclease
VIEHDLDLLASEAIVLVEPERLLRKPNTSKQRARFPAEEQAFKDEARNQMAALGREGFPKPTPVSVQMDIHVPGGRQQPLMPDVVKAYLDALEGIAYDDDRQIEHLVVHRRGIDHPMMDGYEPVADVREGQVYIDVMPVEAYTRLFDRTFRRRIFRGGAHSPFRNEWRFKKEIELAKLKTKRASLPNGAHAEATDGLIASYEEERITSGAFADIDRPGPLSDGMRRAFRLLPAHALHSKLRGVAGSRLVLPLPGQGEGTSSIWKNEVDRRFERHQRHRLMARSRLRSWVALDVAVRGASIDGKDLDNLARQVITRFEAAYCVRPGTVASYRAYQAVGSPEGVQVRMMSEPRMLGLEIALSETRGQMVEAIYPPLDNSGQHQANAPSENSRKSRIAEMPETTN